MTFANRLKVAENFPYHREKVSSEIPVPHSG